MQKEKPGQPELKKLKKQLLSLEKRLTKVEKSINKIKSQDIRIPEVQQEQTETDIDIQFPFRSKGSIESSIGEYGMAWLGNIVLLFGIVFLVQYLFKSGTPVLSAFVGYAAIAGIYTGSYFTREAYSYLSKLFYYNGHLLLYFLTLRLHFFQSNPLIKNLNIELSIVIIVLGALFYLSYRRKSQLMAGVVLLMMLILGIISNSTHFLLGISTFTALLSVFLYYRFGWIKIVIAFISFVYLVLLNWLLSNPFIGNELVLRESHEFGFLYLIAIGVIYSLLAILPKKGNTSNDLLITSVIWNGLGFTFILLLTVFSYFSSNYVLIFGIIALFCLIYSIVLQSHSFLKITASIYALYGFIAISVTIYGIFLFPKAYMLLSIQSFLVVSMALWFRSRFIVVMNTILFVLLMIFYLNSPVSYNSTNFSFMFVAFITARVINWKKERLNIKTEFLRNIYLVSGFIMTLIAFYHAIPKSFVTASWIFVAILFFILSLLLKNVKYRWLAIATMIASAINLLLVDMSNINIEYRILIFLFLAIISIAISIFYTKWFIKRKG
ncbi:hypothetical protein MNBD_BACTEROID01-845 [hydrothermal vent metagenome]|uniref:DUF2339 domain-containing protein n=1 Tax=hydrothermal vent metagenome TaxID=652676 RepID=A0A3B0TY15_9ZZZZ